MGAGAIIVDTTALLDVVVLHVPCCPLALSPATAILLEHVTK